MTPGTSGLRPLLNRLRRTLRRDASLAVALGALSVVPLALLLAWLLGWVLPWSRPGFGPLLLDVVALAAAAGLVTAGVRRWIRTVDERAVAADVEQRSGLAEGSLVGVLELEREVPQGTSAALARRAYADLERRFAGARREDVTGRLGVTVRRRRGFAAAAFAVSSLVVVLLALAAPEHSRAAWSPMARPVSSMLPPPLPPLAVVPGDATVNRGADLTVRVSAPGRSLVTLRWKMQGDVPREEMATVTGDSAVARIPAIDAAAEYWVEAPDGAASPRYHVTPVDPLLLADLSVDVVYPAYAARPAEHYVGEVPLLEMPEGTQLIVRGRATRPLATAALTSSGQGPGARFRLDDTGFSGEWTPRQSGTYVWELRDGSGEELAIRPAPLEILVVPDAAPQVEITYPEIDTILDASLRQPVVADARDDYGLASATLVSWRVARDGRRDPEVEMPIALGSDARTIIRTLVDASERGLLAGDTLKFFVRVTDNSSRRQTSTSRTVSLRLPGTPELRELAERHANELLKRVEELTRAIAEAQEATTALERRTAAANARRQAQRQQQGTRSGERDKLDFQDAAQAKQALEKQQQFRAEIEAMRQNLDELEKAMARAGVKDARLQERIDELRKLYDEMLSPEFQQQLEQLQKALEQLDPEAVQKALEQLAKQQEELREQLEKSTQELERAAAEQQVNNLAQEARELATQQQALSRDMQGGKPSPEQAKQQEELARRAQELAQELGKLEEKLRSQGEQNAAERMQTAEKQASQAEQQMKDAARDAARQDGQKAAERGKEAAEQLQKTAESLDQARKAMADAQRDQVQQSMQQATADALNLAQQQQDILEKLRQAEQGQQPQGQQQQGQQQQGQRPQQGQQQQGQQQQGQQQQGQQQQGQQQQGQQQQGQQQQGQQQQGQQQQGQQQQGQQQQGQQQQGQQQGQQQQGQQQGQQGQTQGQQGQRPGQQQGAQPQPGQQPGAGAQDQALRSEQAALQQSLQQLGRNLTEAAERNAGVNREVSSSLARANLAMQETLEAMQRGRSGTQEAQQAVDALNRLALALLNSSQQMQQMEGGSNGQQEQLADLAKQQSSINGQSNALVPMNLSQQAVNQQMQRLANDQMDIARRLGSLNEGAKETGSGDLDALAKEAAELARQLSTGRIPPEVLARQERLFHRLLDAGRSLEKDEYEEERTGERAGRFDPRRPPDLDPRLFIDPTRFPRPTAEQLQAQPPAYRGMILDYFERLNRATATGTQPTEKPTGR